MKHWLPASPESRRDLLDFTPVERRYRYDGWTVARQRGFIAALAETGSVKAACRRINMSTEGAYYLRRQPGAESLCAAWSAALAGGVQRLTDIAIDRAIEGVPVPIFHKGEQVGEKRWYNDKLLMFIMKHHIPAIYGGPLGGGTKHPDTVAREAAEERKRRDEHARSIARKIYAVRHHFLLGIIDDAERRAAWELLAGPADWERIRAGARGDDGYDEHNMTSPTMTITLAAMAGMLDSKWKGGGEAARKQGDGR